MNIQQSLLSRSIASALFTALIASSLALTPTQAQAQDEEDHSADLDRIQVTGSRIPRQGFVTPSPVTALSAEEIRATGAITIGELMNALPALQNTFSLGNSSRFIGTVGLGLLDLRGLGTARTLVLVNGRRHVGSSPGSSAVDVNTIPVEWIERVEVITGGASAVYGADAVAGAVNFILKRDFDGFEARGQYGKAGEGGFDRGFASFSGGSSFAEGRGSAAFSMEFSTQERFQRSDREIGRRFDRSMPNPDFDPSRAASQDNPARIFLRPGGLFTLSNGGRFVVDGVSYLFDPDGSFRAQRFDGIVDGASCVNCDFLDLNNVADLQPSLDRFSFNTLFRFDLNENHQLFAEGKYTTIKTDFRGQPSFDQINGPGTAGGLIISLDNPFVSPELRQLHEQAGRNVIRVARFNVDAGQRGEEVERQTSRVVLGLEGALGRDWTYETSVVYGQTTVDRVNLSNRINERFQAGIDATVDANGNIVCRSSLDPSAINPHTGQVYSSFSRTGCVPFTIFGDGRVSDEAAEWFNARSVNQSKLTQSVVSLSVGNSALFELPAGGIGFAAGAEYRKETSVENTDPLSALGLTFLNAIPSRAGDYNVAEVFAEVSVPLLRDIFLIENLTLDLAGRYSDYNTIGSTTTWNIGLDWTILPELRVRSTLSQAVRAPNIAELFNPQSQNFAFINDPCDSRITRPNSIPNAADPALRAANCAALGIPTNFEDNVASNRPGLSGGNPDLQEEEARTFSYGFVWQPSFVRGLGISADYWRVNLTDAIGSVTAQTNATRCVDSPGGIDNVFCNAIRRAGPEGFVDAAGRAWGPYEIFTWTALSENLARSLRSGVDVEVDYGYELFGANMNSRLLVSRALQYREFAFQNFPDEFTESVTVVTAPRYRARLTNSVRHGNWRASWDMRYVHHNLRVALASFQTNPGQISPITNGSHTYHNLQGGYTFGDNTLRGLDLYFGIDNVTDKEPPIDYFGQGVGEALYDNIGRFYYAGLTYRF